MTLSLAGIIKNFLNNLAGINHVISIKRNQNRIEQ